MRDAGVVDEHVETAELVPDALRGGGDGGLIRDVELERAGIRSDALRGRLAMLEVARPDEHGEAVRREILRDLKTDSFVGPGHQGDGFVVHSYLLCCILNARASRWRSRARAAHLLGRDAGHLAEAIIREILCLSFFDRLQNETGDEFGLVAISVIG